MRDVRTEARLTRCGIKWEYVEKIPLKRIRVDKSVLKNIRLENGQLDEETVSRYAMAIRRGDKLPAGVLCSDPADTEQLVVLGGCHRTTAQQREELKDVSAYMAETEPDSPEAQRYIRSANVDNGLPPSMAERVRQALHLVRIGFPVEQAADDMLVKVSAVQAAKREDEAVEILRSNGVPSPTTLNKRQQQLLVSIPPSVMKGVAAVVRDAALTDQEAQREIRQLKKSGDALGSLKDMQQRYGSRMAAVPTGRRRRTWVAAQTNALLRAWELLHDHDETATISNKSERRALLAAWEKLENQWRTYSRKARRASARVRVA